MWNFQHYILDQINKRFYNERILEEFQAGTKRKRMTQIKWGENTYHVAGEKSLALASEDIGLVFRDTAIGGLGREEGENLIIS